MHSHSLSPVCLLLLALTACGVQPQAAATPTPIFVVTVPANATPTLTPFQPAGFLSTPAPVASGDVQPPSDEQSSSAAEPIPQPAGQVSIILLGSDQRPTGNDFRTDVMILVTLRADHTVSLVSFPRDLYVYLPGLNSQRINAAMEFGGFDMLSSTLEYNFGIRPQHYILTNFNGFQSIVDSLGGIDVNVAQTLSDTRTGYPYRFTVYSGLVHMNGEMALWYVRSRKSTSDIDRLRRAQEVMVALSQKLFSLNGLGHLPEAYAAYHSAVVTDLTLDDALSLLPLLRALDPNRVNRYAITTDQATPWIDPNSGSYYLLPDPIAIRQLLQQAVGIP
jgi:polyisoprenyl-teichoic acid--peptidoglycan teichoic acid transferase